MTLWRTCMRRDTSATLLVKHKLMMGAVTVDRGIICQMCVIFIVPSTFLGNIYNVCHLNVWVRCINKMFDCLSVVLLSGKECVLTSMYLYILVFTSAVGYVGGVEIDNAIYFDSKLWRLDKMKIRWQFHVSLVWSSTLSTTLWCVQAVPLNHEDDLCNCPIVIQILK